MKFFSLACLSLTLFAVSGRSADAAQPPAAHAHHKKKHHGASAHHHKSHSAPQGKASDSDMNVPATAPDTATHI